MKKYVLFGAGFTGEIGIEHIGKNNIDFIVDNASEKDGTSLRGIPVFLFDSRKDELKDYTIVITVKPELCAEIIAQLRISNISNYITLQELERQMIQGRIKESIDNKKIYKRAVDWILANSLECGAIINNTGQPCAYPEVTGYFIPSLLHWGYRELAVKYAQWLISIQKEDGSWYDMDDNEPFVFDTAQILKGLIAIYDILPEVEGNIIKGCEWLLSQTEKNGRLPAVNPNTWGDGKTLSELIHIYCLSPLKKAGELFEREDFSDSADKILEYYLSNYRDKILNFHLLSHFYAYVIEGLVDMGEIELAKEAMNKVAAMQRESGAVPAYKNVNWVCSTGLFQFAVIWYRLGNYENGEKAFTYACKLQNDTGGWYGSYPSEEGRFETPEYLPDSEISWANKYFFDALRYRGECLVERQADFYMNLIDKESSVYKTIADEIKEIGTDNSVKKVLDIGCGKGGISKT